MFLVVTLVATLTVLSKVLLYDWGWMGGEGPLSGKQVISMEQAKYSNIKYTGNGFIPKDYLQFHSRLVQREEGE